MLEERDRYWHSLSFEIIERQNLFLGVNYY